MEKIKIKDNKALHKKADMHSCKEEKVLRWQKLKTRDSFAKQITKEVCGRKKKAGRCCKTETSSAATMTNMKM